MIWPLALVLAAGAGSTGAAMRLDDPKVPVAQKIQAAKELGNKGDRAGIDALLRALDGPGEELPRVAADSLRQLRAVPVLIERAIDEKRPLNERRLAVKGLRVLKDPEGFKTLAALLSSPHEGLRADAAWALAVAGAAEAEAELIKAVSDPSKDVRYFAAVALGEVKSRAARDAIAARKKEEKDPVVIDALIQAGQRQAR